jgi:hypothetical protein
MSNKYPENPNERAEANGVCLLMCLLEMPRKATIEKEFFFGKRAEEEADKASAKWTNPESIDDLAPGIYELRLHPAWKGNEEEPHDYDPTDNLMETVRFIIESKKVIRFL